MKKTSLIIIGIALALATLALFHNNRAYPAALSPVIATTSAGAVATTTPAPADNVTLKAADRTYGAHITSHESVLTLMRTLASTTGFTFAGEEYPSLGFFVESIGGVKNAGGKYWILYINGKSSDLGASNASITSGDTVEWRYEKSY